MSKPKTLSELKLDLELLKNVRTAPEVLEAARKVMDKRKPKIEALEKQIEELRSKRPAKSPRWPANTPANVLKAAEDRWRGSTEFHTFRIHMWNSKAFWTSYPSGGYSNNGGWNPTPASFELISLTEKDLSMGHDYGKWLAELTGRAPKHLMRALLVEKTGEEPHDIG
jgi:hypothetical protein